jgi:hypothetical protein
LRESTRESADADETVGHRLDIRVRNEEETMAATDSMLLYTAIYGDVNDALSDLDSIDGLHKEDLIGKFDAAVIDEENGEPHIVKRMDRPRVRIIPEAFGGGTLRRKELHEAAQQLGPDQSALIVAGEPTLEKGFDKAVTKADKVIKRTVDATTDQVAEEMREAAHN